jgi:hypothetical protein
MSLAINKKRANILIISTIFLFFSSIWHFPSIIPKPCSADHSPMFISLKVNANLYYSITDLPTSKSTKPFIGKSVNHCTSCGTVITNYTINIDYPIHREQYLLTNVIPEYKEFIPELKPPKFI